MGAPASAGAEGGNMEIAALFTALIFIALLVCVDSSF